MKSIVNQKEEVKEKGFPKLMISESSKNVVWFSKSEVGVVVYSENIVQPVGYTYCDWNMDYFKDFNGTVTLSND